MKVTRERTEILLMEYASGALDDSCALMVASYITLCPKARDYVRQCEHFGGALVEHQCTPVAMHKGSLQNVLDRLDSDIANACSEDESSCGFCEEQTLPAPLSRHIDRNAPKAKWQKVAPGIEVFSLPTKGCEYALRLVKMAPNTRAPKHKHPGTEMTLVLEGSFHDAFGQYKAGDFVCIEEETEHTPIADQEGCLCMIATNKPVRFTGPWGLILGLFER